MARLTRFLLVGALCALLNLLVFYWLIGTRHWPTWEATLVAFFAVNAVGYWLNKHYTFRTPHTAIGPEAARYYVAMALSLLANVTAMRFLVDVAGVHYLLASLLLSGAFTIVNFLAQLRYTFRGARESAELSPQVLLVTHYYPAHGGGVEIVAGELARRLAGGHGSGIEWWASAGDALPAYPGVVVRPVSNCNFLERRAGIPVPLWAPSALLRLARRARAATVVHVHDLLYPGNVVAALAAITARRPLIVTQHLSLVPYRNRVLRAAMRLATRLVTVPLLERADRVVFIADSARQFFEPRCRWRRAPLLIPNGVDLATYRAPSAAERMAARAALLGVAADHTAVLFVGRFVEKKGLPLLREVAASMSHTAFLFAGSGLLDPEGWALSNVRVLRGRSGRGLRELYWAADVLALPSVGEGFPLVVQEALASGLAAVVSPEVASGSTAAAAVLRVEALGPGAPARWRTALDEAVATESPQRRERLAQFASRQWSWDATAASYAGLLGELDRARTTRSRAS